VLGYARRFQSEIVNYADNFCVISKASAEEMLTNVRQLMEPLKLTSKDGKSRCLRCPDEAIEFLGYRIGCDYRPQGEATIGTRPSKASVAGICRRISAQTAARYGVIESADVVRGTFAVEWVAGFSGLPSSGGRTTTNSRKSIRLTRRLMRMRQSGCDNGSVENTRWKPGSMGATRAGGCGMITA